MVLLSSYLLNTPASESRAGLLRACARHLKPSGAAAIQVRGPGILQDLSDFEREVDGVRDWVDAYHRDGPLVTITMRTEWEGRRWVQTFIQRYLDEADLRPELAAQGLRFERWLDAAPEWIVAGIAENI